MMDPKEEKNRVKEVDVKRFDSKDRGLKFLQALRVVNIDEIGKTGERFQKLASSIETIINSNSLEKETQTKLIKALWLVKHAEVELSDFAVNLKNSVDTLLRVVKRTPLSKLTGKQLGDLVQVIGQDRLMQDSSTIMRALKAVQVDLLDVRRELEKKRIKLDRQAWSNYLSTIASGVGAVGLALGMFSFLIPKAPDGKETAASTGGKIALACAGVVALGNMSRAVMSANFVDNLRRATIEAYDMAIQELDNEMQNAKKANQAINEIRDKLSTTKVSISLVHEMGYELTPLENEQMIASLEEMRDICRRLILEVHNIKSDNSQSSSKLSYWIGATLSVLGVFTAWYIIDSWKKPKPGTRR
ncbi:hypothetical protein AAMO2058_001093600 [Amorphochlora amoebiformis]